MSQATAPRPRHVLVDLACAVAFFLLSFYLTRATKGLGFVALFVFIITAGSGYAFARSAWRGITGEPDTKRLPKG